MRLIVFLHVDDLFLLINLLPELDPLRFAFFPERMSVSFFCFPFLYIFLHNLFV